MKWKTAKAFAPAAISSFFEIHDTEDNKPITDLERVGARGGGFGLEKGVLTQVTVKEAEKYMASTFRLIQTLRRKQKQPKNGN